MRIIGRQIEKDRLEAFAKLETFLSGASVRQSPHGKRIIFFDEFPWFATPRSDFPAAVHLKRNRTVLP